MRLKFVQTGAGEGRSCSDILNITLVPFYVFLRAELPLCAASTCRSGVVAAGPAASRPWSIHIGCLSRLRT